MAAQVFIAHVENKIYEAFESQTPKLFDTVFEIEGKKIYADKLRLSVISTTFESMLSDRWNSKNEPIEIKNFNYNNFKALLTYIYSGEYQINDSNIYDTLDMAAFYQLDHLKKLCEEHLAKMEINFGNIFQFLETSNKYSLIEMKQLLQNFILLNFDEFIKMDAFLNAEKEIIGEICTFEPSERFFDAIYQWTEYQAFKKQQDSIDEKFNKNDAIKAEMSPLFPYIQFNKMKITFVKRYLAQKRFLFTENEFNEILASAIPEVKVKITNASGKSISGFLSQDSQATEVIKSLKDRPSDNSESLLIFWNTNREIPSTPSPMLPLQKQNDRKLIWYLAYLWNGNIGLTNSYNLGRNEYLLTEMIPEDGTDFFQKSIQCKIDIEPVLNNL